MKNTSGLSIVIRRYISLFMRSYIINSDMAMHVVTLFVTFSIEIIAFFESLKFWLKRSHMINKILHLWSIYIQLMNQAKARFLESRFKTI